VHDVHSAILENNGTITVISRQALRGNATDSTNEGK